MLKVQQEIKEIGNPLQVLGFYGFKKHIKEEL